MNTTYIPRPGSLAEKAFLHLNSMPSGSELTATEIADVMGAELKNVSGTLHHAVKNGLLLARREGRKLLYSLGTGEPVTPARSAAEDADTDIDFGTDADADQTPFCAALWSDGDMMMTGAQVMDDGAVFLRRHQVAELYRYLLQVGGIIEQLQADGGHAEVNGRSDAG